jgi:hypothetical protein
MIATRKAKKPGAARKPVDLAKSLEALDDFQENPNNHGHHPDRELKGLFLHVGPRSMVWRYRRQRMAKGVRKMTFKSLGSYPAVGVEEARKREVHRGVDHRQRSRAAVRAREDQRARVQASRPESSAENLKASMMRSACTHNAD